ncbi:maleylacetate reductase [Dactylosporangium sp. CA-233914]|uniref:maleylacetate reductase n=1 Tax=Dactylosporangium sp. CA-233914 TaxID=3239934 RepID=UPI003D909CB2
MGLTFDHHTLGQRVLFGTGAAVDNTAAAVAALGSRRVLLIADPFVADLADAVAARTPVVARIRDVVAHVPIERARTAVAVARDNEVDAVVTIGGGSSTGLAKIVARDTGLPIVAIPTTFAGSEATDVWGMTEAHRKTTGVDPNVLPKIVVYDAALSTSLPGRLAVASGLNAVAHAIDGFWAPRADPINRALGTEGLRALIPGLRALHANPDDLDTREQLLYGAYLAAVAFASAGSGMHHKICHALGGAYNLPHADTHAIMLGYVISFNGPAAPDAQSRISAAFDELPGATGLFQLRRDLGAVKSLADIGFAETDIPDAARIILPSIPPSNPRPVTQADLESLLHDAWAGVPVKQEGP